MKLLYYSPSSYGGLADYAHEQAIALSQLGIEVTLLCPPKYLETRTPTYKTISTLRENKPNQPSAHKLVKAVSFVRNTLLNFSTLARTIKLGEFNAVLLGSYIEYLAPLWAGSLRRLAKQGVRFGAVVHDPVRDFVLGPVWWHRRSIAAGYSFLSNAFVHEAIALNTVVPMPNLQVTVIPHGPYQFAEPTESAEDTRLRLRLPKTAKVILAFGHIRDGKNLDLILRAIANLPEVYLIVAGKEQSAGQKPAAYYQALAKDLNIGDRCRWQVEFISEETAANLFAAADIVALTYSHIFRSASGVLGVAAHYQTQCLASGGEGALKTAVTKYSLGTWVEPDSWEAIRAGLKQQLYKPPTSQWEDYYAVNSWLINAKQVVKALKSP